MASLMDNLIDVLNMEHEQYLKLVELSKQKKYFVITADVRGIEDVTEQEQLTAGTLRNLDIRRDEVLSDISSVLGKPFSDMTITRLIGYLEKQPEEQEKLIQIREKLLVTGKEMHDLNKQNESLIQQALEMVEFDLTLFRSMRQAPETANYNKNAYNTGDLLGSGGFDTKQ